MMVPEDDTNSKVDRLDVLPEKEILTDDKEKDTEKSCNGDAILVKVINPEKVGDGMSSYIVYTVETTTNISLFKNSCMSVRRRFSDFIALYETLKSKYLQQGVIIPYPPEKNMMEATKLRLIKGSFADTEFIERRRVSLECFLHKIINHPILFTDSCLREFLETENEMPRLASNQIISGATAKKILKNVGEAVGKLTFKMDESDEYFDTKDEELENWDFQGSRLYNVLVNLVADQNELSNSVLVLSKSLSRLANVEEHTGLARALGQLADTEERVGQFMTVQSEAQTIFLVEYAKNIVNMIQACRDTLMERVRVFKTCREYESALRGKREQKVRIEMSPRADRAKVPTLEREIDELTHRVEESEEVFEKLSSTIKNELELVDRVRFEEFKAAAVSYFTIMLQVQEKVLHVWESFIGHAKAIE